MTQEEAAARDLFHGLPHSGEAMSAHHDCMCCDSADDALEARIASALTAARREGWRAGQAAMRERTAAEVTPGRGQDYDGEYLRAWRAGRQSAANAIRALTLEDPDAE